MRERSNIRDGMKEAVREMERSRDRDRERERERESTSSLLRGESVHDCTGGGDQAWVGRYERNLGRRSLRERGTMRTGETAKKRERCGNT